MTAGIGKDAVNGGETGGGRRARRLRAPLRSCTPNPYLLTFLTLCNFSKSPRSCEREAAY